MSIAYNLGIPASGNNPSQDQPNMQTNNDNIGTYVSVDHIGFISSGDTGVSGRHKQVTFDNNYVPSVPTTPPILFTNNQDGSGNNLPGSLAQLFFYTGAAAAAKNQYFVGANGGSVLLFEGIIIKWGKLAAAPDNTGISFSTASGSAFPNNCFSVTATAINTVTSQNAIVIVGSISVTGFTPRILTVGGTPIAGSINWIAIGN